MNENSKIKGIVCHAEDCKHHCKDNSCDAGCINVCTCSTAAVAECSTYEEKKI